MGSDTKIILAIIGVGLTLAGLLLQQTGAIRGDLADLRGEVADLRDDVTDLLELVERMETFLEYALPQLIDPPLPSLFRSHSSPMARFSAVSRPSAMWAPLYSATSNRPSSSIATKSGQNLPVEVGSQNEAPCIATLLIQNLASRISPSLLPCPYAR